MASPTRVLEAVRGRKRNKRLVARTKRVRKELAKEAANTPAEIRHFVPGVRASGA